ANAAVPVGEKEAGRVADRRPEHAQVHGRVEQAGIPALPAGQEARDFLTQVHGQSIPSRATERLGRLPRIAPCGVHTGRRCRSAARRDQARFPADATDLWHSRAAMQSHLVTVSLLTLSNVFMTFAWYAHLKNMAARPWIVAALASWGIALFEYLLQVPANRVGYTVMSLGQLKI